MHMKIACLIFLLSIVSFVYAQWEYGAFVGTDSSTQSISVWNADDSSSFMSVCQNDNGLELYSLAYTVDIANRKFIYIHGDGKVTHSPFSFNETSNSFVCGDYTRVCDSNWRLNETFRLFHDPALDQTIMIDSLFTYFIDGTEYTQMRVWKYSVPDCELQFVDSFKAGPMEEFEALSAMYDYSNHRLYIMYDAVDLYTHRRIRGVDIRYPSLLFDFELNYNAFEISYSQFDPASGNILFFTSDEYLGNKTSYYGSIISPIHLTQTPVNSYVIKYHQIGPSSIQTSVNWRKNVFVSQVFRYPGETIEQYAWSTLSGVYQTSITLPFQIDNGWFYDPLLTLVPTNINTASKETLETIPGFTQSSAQLITDDRERNGPFQIVDSLLSHRYNVTFSDYQKFRPYICI